MEYRLLGPIVVVDDHGQAVALGPPRQRTLVAALALHHDTPLPADRLIDLLWGEHPPATAATILHGSVAGLRKALEPGRAPGAAAEVLVLEPNGYRLNVASDTIDIAVFEQKIEAARGAVEHDPAGADRMLTSALDLWRGRPFDGVDAEFAIAAAERLEARRLDAIELRAEARIALGDYRSVTAELEPIVGDHPFRERLWALLLAALHYSGRAAEALRYYEQLRMNLVEAMGVDPSLPLRALYEAILREDAALPGFDVVDSASGIATFLLADIEASSPMWERDADRMSVAHRRFHQLVRENARVCRGAMPIEQGKGDGAVLVFGRASDAVECAIAIQRAVRDEPWPAGAAIKARIGLHTGEAELRDGTYHGTTINRCARLTELAHGGQVLLSGTTSDIVADALPDVASLLDLGTHRLRNLARAEHVWQLVHADLERRFPALRGAVAQHNLPAAITGLVGRAIEREQIRDVLERHRLVTLTGPGGCGKTRLAVEVAREMSSRLGGAVWLIELAPLATPTLVVETVAGVIGVRNEGHHPLIETLCASLSDDESLLVLDNCEHVIEGCAALAQAILSAGSQARILTSSREPLGIPGEVVFAVGPLPVAGREDAWDRVVSSEAARLFAERAAAARPGFAVDESNAHLVGEICRRLDGMPLALELAAARVATTPLSRITERLDDRFRLLEGVTRAASPRHRSLEAAVQWSYDLLDDDQRALFDRLAVFSGSFTLDAANALASAVAADAAMLLDGLVARSLVQWTPEDDRYRLLESLREFGRARLIEKGAMDDAQTRHAQYYCALVEQAWSHLRRAGSSLWYDRLECDEPNVRSALEWAFGPTGDHLLGVRVASSMWFYWDVRGADGELAHWAGKALEATRTTTSPERAILLAAFAMLQMRKGDYDAGEQSADAALALVDQIGAHTSPLAREAAAIAAWPKGIARWARGEFDSARRIFEAATHVSLATGDMWFAAQHEFMLGRVLRDSGDLERAESVATNALDHADELGEPQDLGLCCELVASLLRRRGDLARARELIDRALAHYRAVGYSEGEASVLAEAGRLALDAGDCDAARQAFRQSFELCRRMGHRAGMAAALEGQGGVLATIGDALTAATLLAAASALREQIRAPLPAAEQAALAREMKRLEEMLGEASLAAAVARGTTMSTDDLAEMSAVGI